MQFVELAAALVKTGINPDKLSHPELAAELTNHLVDGAVLIPGAAGRCPSCEKSHVHARVLDACQQLTPPRQPA
jgi:hypothetical protein